MTKQNATKEKSYDFDSYQNDGLTKPRDLAWSEPWAKFEAVGDKTQGFIVDVFYRAEDGQFKEQRGLTLKQLDGKYINVAIKRLPFILTKTDDLKLGDPLTIELAELKKSDTKGFSATKVLAFYGKNLPENANQKTVKELEAEDMQKGGSSHPDGEVVNDKNAFADSPFEDNMPTIEA